MHSFYPPITPFATYCLPVDPPHQLYIEECGNPHGIPILVLHGGPGSGCSEDSRRYFDPEIYRIILFDQRGAGRSIPYAELKENNTAALVRDIESIRHLLKIEHWIVYGGSWGSTLALVYGQTHPQHVLGFVLRSIFLGRRAELDWMTNQGANEIFPDYYEKFIHFLPPNERQNIMQAYYKILTGKDELRQFAAAKSWSEWENGCIRMMPKLETQAADIHSALAVAKIEIHYFMHDCFLASNQILENIDKIQDIPSIIVHGRFDILCPLKNAWELHKAWPNSELRIIRQGCHAGSEEPMLDGIIHATIDMARRFA